MTTSRVSIVLPSEFDRLLEVNPEYAAKIQAGLDDLAALVEPVIEHLGYGWSASVSDNRIINLTYCGGHSNLAFNAKHGTPEATLADYTGGGFNLHARCEGYYPDQASYTKFSFRGDYPQPAYHDDYYEATHKGAPSATIDLKNAKSAAQQIVRRLVPGVTEHTAAARKNVADSSRRRTDFYTNAVSVAKVMGKDWTRISNLRDSYQLLKEVRNLWIETELRASGKVNLKVDGLTVNQLEQVIDFITKLAAGEPVGS